MRTGFLVLLAGSASALRATPRAAPPARRHVPPRALAGAAVDVLAAAPAALPQFVTLGAGMLGGAIGVGVAYPLDTLKTKVQAYSGDGAGGAGADMSALGVAREIVRAEGLSGFYPGVSSTMAGQAVIKGVVFFVYEAAKTALAPYSSGALGLIAAACISGAA